MNVNSFNITRNHVTRLGAAVIIACGRLTVAVGLLTLFRLPLFLSIPIILLGVSMIYLSKPRLTPKRATLHNIVLYVFGAGVIALGMWAVGEQAFRHWFVSSTGLLLCWLMLINGYRDLHNRYRSNKMQLTASRRTTQLSHD